MGRCTQQHQEADRPPYLHPQQPQQVHRCVLHCCGHHNPLILQPLITLSGVHAESGQITQVSVHDRSSSSSACSTSRQHHLLTLYPSPSGTTTTPTTTVPFTFLNISATSPSYCDTGRAKLPVKLLNFRTPGFVLRLVINGTFFPVILAESALITNTIVDAPGQVHLAQHADGHSVVVQWVSGSSSPQQLHYSTTKWTKTTTKGRRSTPSSRTTTTSSGSEDIVHSVASTSMTYTADMMCGVPANSFGFLDPGHLHTAVIPHSHVGHGKQLYYRCVDMGGGGSTAPNAQQQQLKHTAFTSQTQTHTLEA